MNSAYDVAILGAGANGLTAATLLAKAGKRVVVVDRRATVGGALVTEELIPGFHFDSVTSDAGWLSPALVKELQLRQHGLDLLEPEASLVTPFSDGRALAIWRDAQRSYASIRSHSPRDSQQWTPFAERLNKLAGFLASLYAASPPRPIGGGARELVDMALLGRRARALGKTDMIELLRVLPMSMAELLDDWFELDPLKAAVGAGGINGIQQGVRSAGTSFVLLHHHIGQSAGGFRMRQRYRGGVGALSAVLANAARAAGVEIRLETEVTQIIVKDWTAHGLLLGDADAIPAATVLASTSARTTLIDLVDVAQLDPEFVHAVGNVRARGVKARVHLALNRLPSFRGVDAEALRGVISIAPDLNYIERAYDDAKYGRMSARPVLEVRIPSLTDASLAPAGKHSMSIDVQYAPFQLRSGPWTETERTALGDAVIRTLTEYAPDLHSLLIDRRVLTPADLQDNYALPEGSLDYAELGLDQILFMRPLGELARYATPIQNLYLCGADTHPGRALTGASGRLAARTILGK
ncbi:MAG TPA: NAD(P)/FAD-dependent oxidoreductase [Longimicrobiales bacterium]